MDIQYEVSYSEWYPVEMKGSVQVADKQSSVSGSVFDLLSLASSLVKTTLLLCSHGELQNKTLPFFLEFQNNEFESLKDQAFVLYSKYRYYEHFASLSSDQGF